MTHTESACTLPLSMSKTLGSFEQFYLSRHSGRRLTLQPALGNVDVKVSFKAKKIELNVSTFALVILLLFEDVNDDEFLTYSVRVCLLSLRLELTLGCFYKEIKQATSIVDSELQRNLQSLACAKFKVLKKHPPGREVNTDDSFSFNNEFTSQLSKIKINTISSKVESNEERKETRDRIDEERKHQTEVFFALSSSVCEANRSQACIVRIMKDRKHMGHNDLINEVARQLASRFQPNPLNIKKRIEGLIEVRP